MKTSTAESDEIAALFRRQWQTYRKVVDQDIMSHRMFYGELRRILASRTAPFSVLELACGDAGCSSGAFAGLPVDDYTGVDLSAAALDIARQNLADASFPVRVIETDFRGVLENPGRRWDVIFVGFSYHHLVGDEKVAFARQVRGALNRGGEWIFMEPVRLEHEERAQFLARWKADLDASWTDFTAEEREACWEHVRQFDHPETLSRFEEIARATGFAEAECLAMDPRRFYGMLRLR